MGMLDYAGVPHGIHAETFDGPEHAGSDLVELSAAVAVDVAVGHQVVVDVGKQTWQHLVDYQSFGTWT